MADTLPRTHLEETTDGIPEEELTVQVDMVHESAPTTKSRLEQIKEETAKDARLKKLSRSVL